MDWTNVDLDSAYESSQDILDGYSFDTLLLEASCNLKEINEQTIREQFHKSLASKVNSAKDVFEANLKNIVAKALKERNSD